MISKFDNIEPWRYDDMKGVEASEIGPDNFETFGKQASVPKKVKNSR